MLIRGLPVAMGGYSLREMPARKPEPVLFYLVVMQREVYGETLPKGLEVKWPDGEVRLKDHQDAAMFRELELVLDEDLQPGRYGLARIRKAVFAEPEEK